MYTVLIVDDEDPARNMLDLLLDWEKAGFRIIGKAENGRKAIEIYNRKHVDLVITDIQMPVMDGIELIAQIKEKKPDQSIVVLSCHESFAYAQQVLRLGVEDYLIKDMLTGEQLKECLDRVVKKMEKHDEPVKKLLFSRESTENIEKVYPAWMAKAENRMDLLQNNLMKKDYNGARKCICSLYQVPFEGMVKCHFLNWVNHYVYMLLRMYCRKDGIKEEKIFGKYTGMENEILLEADCEEASCELLCGFLERLEQLHVKEDPYSMRIQKVIEYLEENYYQNISLQSVAEYFGIHKVYLARSFKTETGETLNDFLTAIRIEKAKFLLMITDNKVNEVGYTVGFNSVQSFYTAFKKREGCSPNEYRRKNGKN